MLCTTFLRLLSCVCGFPQRIYTVASDGTIQHEMVKLFFSHLFFTFFIFIYQSLKMQTVISAHNIVPLIKLFELLIKH